MIINNYDKSLCDNNIYCNNKCLFVRFNVYTRYKQKLCFLCYKKYLLNLHNHDNNHKIYIL